MDNFKDEFIFKDLSFHPISELLGDTKMIEEFVVNYIIPHNHNYFKSKLLKNLGSSDLWILYTKPCYKNVLRPGEKWWNEFMDTEMFNNFEKYNGIILGFMFIEKSKKRSYKFIDVVDTRLRGHNLTEMMINRWEQKQQKQQKHKKKLYIQAHTQSSSEFWLKLFTKQKKMKFVKNLLKNNEVIEWRFNEDNTWINPLGYSKSILI